MKSTPGLAESPQNPAHALQPFWSDHTPQATLDLYGIGS